ncbi:MAG: DNA translocase FtsK 4TM domain-containing protein, partial [Bacteroidales bacterium]|nr:DNA translocase FtsK 4TM domain-containing protein [Bacteroidales bacterium]
MKRKNNLKKNIKVKSNQNRFGIFKDNRVKLLIGLFLIGFALFLLLAFISFFFSWKTDQSFEWSSAFSNSEIRVLNWSGKTGAYFSNLLINKWFGIASFFIPILLLLIGLRMLNLRILPVWKIVKTGLIAIILLSVILSYIFGDSGGYLGSGLGGGHGFYISNWLNAFLGKAGTGFLLLFLLTAFLIFSFGGIMHLFQRKEKVPDENFGISGFSDIISDKDSDKTIPGKYNIGEEDNELTPFQIKDINKEQEKNKNEIKQTTDDIELTIEQRKSSEDEESGEITSQPYDPALDLPSYKIPGTELLKEY